MAARGVRRRELVRTAIGDLAGLLDLDQVGTALTDVAVATLDGVLRACAARVALHHGGRAADPAAGGRHGPARRGRAGLRQRRRRDVRARSGRRVARTSRAHDAAMAVFSELRRLLAAPGPDPALEVDADLRPEGRNGPLVRTLDSYDEYYRRWSLTWEAQALTRAVPVAGDEDLAARFVALVDPLRWPVGGLDDAAVREIRRIKARVESERLPRGADPHPSPQAGPWRDLRRRVDAAAAPAAARARGGGAAHPVDDGRAGSRSRRRPAQRRGRH